MLVVTALGHREGGVKEGFGKASGVQGRGAGRVGWRVCSPAHIGVQLHKIPPRAVQQRMEHHLDNNLAGGVGMKEGGAWASYLTAPTPSLHNNSDPLARLLAPQVLG